MPEKFNIPKYLQVIKFHVLNFRCFEYPRKDFTSEFLSIYGMRLYVNLHLVNNCTQQSVEFQLPLYLEYLDLTLLNIFSRIISHILPLCMHFDVYLQVSSTREHEPTGYL